MSESAITLVTEALKTRLESAVGQNKVYVGPPLVDEVGLATATVSLFLFHLAPCRELRNAERWTPTQAATASTDPLALSDGLPLDIRYLLTVFRVAGNGAGADANELTTLGQVIRILHAEPTLVVTSHDAVVQEVRVTPEPYSVEDVSRIWGMLPQASYRTSLVYLATPVFVDAELIEPGPPVELRRLRAGIAVPAPGNLR